ncbi:hypothetical protein [Streptacidiphilus jiangxiensis]|nr:hypothetical protein [Streptacidiphilus jiangxiensis]
MDHELAAEMLGTGLTFPPNLGAVVRRTVANGELPALVVIHDPDGDWLVGDGINDPNIPDACGIYCLAHVAEMDPAITETAGLRSGFAAYRDDAGQPWKVEPFAFEDE